MARVVDGHGEKPEAKGIAGGSAAATKGSARPSVRFCLLGGAGEIGASSMLVEVGDTSLLIDCGIRFRTGNTLPDLDVLSGRSIDAILVTHAHTDHTGALPVVHEAFPAAPIHMTPPTVDLCRILQHDALRLMDSAAEREGELPLYGERQVESMLAAVQPVQLGSSFAVGEVEVTFLPASHILGAAMVHLATPGGNVLVTGDFSVSAQRTVPALDRPRLPVDILVTESTYGNRLHSDRRAAENRLVGQVAEVVEAGGRVLIPAFAIGRAQEVLLILKRALREGRLPEVPVFVDGMVRSVCRVYGKHERYVSRELLHEITRSGHPFFSDPIRAVQRPDERRAVLATSPSVIVSSSGMLSGGPSAFYAAEMAGCERDAILITGYQDEESPGRALLRLAESTDGPRELRFGERSVEVSCRFATYGLSAHADRMQIAALVAALRPRTVILVHGDAAARAALAETLSCRDVVQGEDGAVVERGYRPRGAAPRPETGLELTPDEAAALLGPATGSPLPVARLAEAWYGRESDAAAGERLAVALEATGLARRDDHRRWLIWPLTTASGSAPTAEEAALAEELKQLNPKGKLLELCARRRLEAPELVETTSAGGRPAAELRLEVEGETLTSGVHDGSTCKVAEQLAARALLELLEIPAADDGAETVSDDTEETLRRRNPKGRLLELCAQLKLARPELETTPVPGGFIARATLPALGLAGRPFRATRARTAEQAAAADLLEALDRRQQETGSAHHEEVRAPVPPVGVPDPRMELNELRQQGLLRDFGYRTVDQRGPSHQPIFVIASWAEAPGGAREEGPPIEAGAKKEAQAGAAAALLEHLRGLGWC